MKKSTKKNDKVKSLLESTEEISFTEKDAAVEDLSDTGVIKECFSEGEFNEEGVIDRVRLI